MSMRGVTETLYLVVGLAGVALLAWGARRPDSVAPLSRILRAVSRSRAARLVLVVFWWWLGWHFFVTPPLLNA